MDFPANSELEKDLISYIVRNPHTLPDAEALSPEHFWVDDHKQIWSLLRELKHSWSKQTLKSRLSDYHKELIETYYQSTVSPQIEDTVEVLKTLAVKRSVVELSTNLVGIADNDDIDTILDHLEKEINCIRSLDTKVSVDNLGVMALLERMRKDRVSRKSRNFKGVTSGFGNLTQLIGEYKPGGLHIIAARPGMGKTSLAINMLLNMAEMDGIKCAFFTLEMTADQIGHRIMSLLTTKPFSYYANDKLSDTEYEVAETEFTKLNDKLFMYDQSPITIDGIGVIARRLVSNYGVQCIFIDYLQLIRVAKSYGNKVAEITEISNKLKDIAKSLNVPIICLSQLSRECERRDDKRPDLPDLRESGSIEQDADSVSMVYSDDYYSRKDEITEMQVEVIVRKNRHGPKGTAHFLFDMPMCLFREAI
jgi:replicative DNA helicase